MSGQQDGDNTLTLRIGHDEVQLRQRYEALSIANDVLIALWFVVGSVLFFWETLFTAATWCFLLGSVQFLARPAIRLGRRVHLTRVRGSGRPTDPGDDY